MAVQSKRVYIAACDVTGCSAVYGEDPEFAYHFDTEAAALAWVDEGTGWTVDSGQLTCPVDDRAHDQARIPGLLL